MEPRQARPTDDAPRWRRIADFPLVALVLAVVLYAFATALAILVLSSLPIMTRSMSAFVHAVTFVGLGFITYKVGIRHLGERLHDDLPRRGALRNLGLGLLTGFVLFGAIVVVAAAAGVYRIVDCCSTSDLVSDLFNAAVLAGFMEELFFRGILFRWIEEFGGTWAGLIGSSILFGLAHGWNPNSDVTASTFIAVEAGILLGGAYMLTRSLWMPMGLHAAWNFTQGFLFDVPVSGIAENGLVTAKLSGPALLSGGQFGLEGSVIALVIATAAGIWLVILAVRRGQLVQPWWVRKSALSAN
jgi:hypothetical protein